MKVPHIVGCILSDFGIDVPALPGTWDRWIIYVDWGLETAKYDAYSYTRFFFALVFTMNKNRLAHLPVWFKPVLVNIEKKKGPSANLQFLSKEEGIKMGQPFPHRSRN